MNTPIDNRITKDMKYIALYWALGFEEIEPDIFVKNMVLSVALFQQS